MSTSWLQQPRVVVPVDFSAAADQAVEVAMKIGEPAEHIHVLHVLSSAPSLELGGVLNHETADESRRQAAFQQLEQRFVHHPGIQFAVGFGDPGQAIVGFAAEIGAGLIVIPSHGRTGISRLLIGSVAERVCRLAECPVLVLRRKPE